LDPCGRQPVTEIAHADRWVGKDAAARNASIARATRHRKLWEYGLGLLNDVQEHLDEARYTLESALDDVEAEGPALDRAMILWALGQVAGRQGRVDDAIDLLTRAERDAPNHPAILRAEGEAFARVWRFREAIVPLRTAAELAPRDDALWATFATVLGSAGEDYDAFETAKHVLSLSPRSEPALRVQAIALDGLLQDEPQSSRALDAYLFHREPDSLSDIKLACAARSTQCAIEQRPIHVHQLGPR
jgi:predicted Zn-dependent protease